MIRVETAITIQRPPGEVFAYISNFENNPRWQSGIASARITSEGPLGVGTTYIQKARFLGRDIHSSFEVIAYEPGRMVKATTRESTFPITFMRHVAPATEGARVNALLEGDARGVFKLAEPWLRAMVRRSIERDYRRLKTILEEGD